MGQEVWGPGPFRFPFRRAWAGGMGLWPLCVTLLTVMGQEVLVPGPFRYPFDRVRGSDPFCYPFHKVWGRKYWAPDPFISLSTGHGRRYCSPAHFVTLYKGYETGILGPLPFPLPFSQGMGQEVWGPGPFCFPFHRAWAGGIMLWPPSVTLPTGYRVE